MGVQETMQLGIQICTLGGVAFAVYKSFSGPSIQLAKDIALLQQGCGIKHAIIDKSISDTENNILLIKENHLNHIEIDIGEIKTSQAVMLNMITSLQEKK